MTGMIVTGHGSFATGITSGLRLLAGEPAYYEMVDFLPEDSVEVLAGKLKGAADRLADCQDIIIYADLTGGSPFNVSIRMKMEGQMPMEVIGGANLPMILDGYLAREGAKDAETLARSGLTAGREAMVWFQVPEEGADDEYEESEDKNMTFFQALLIGLFAYLGSKRTPWFFGVTGGWNMIGRPLVAGLIVGLVLGDVRNGVIAGAMVQALFIGQITPGGAMPADVNWAAYVGIPLALAAGGTGEQAVALSVPLSMLGLGLFNFIMTINAYFPHMGDKAAAKGDGRGIHRATYLAAVPSFILRAGSAMLLCYLGTPVAEMLINNMPAGMLHFFEVAGKMLPAIGFAMLLKQSLSKQWMLVLFLLGWVMIGATSMSVTALAIFATAVAIIFVMAQGSAPATVPAPQSTEEEDDCYEE